MKYDFLTEQDRIYQGRIFVIKAQEEWFRDITPYKDVIAFNTFEKWMEVGESGPMGIYSRDKDGKVKRKRFYIDFDIYDTKYAEYIASVRQNKDR